MTGMTVILFLLMITFSNETAPGVLHDYCERDYFEADCPPGEIVIMEEARYGRMELGTCLTTDFGYLNCYSNVLHVLDRWCSGRHACRVKVSLLVDFRNSCKQELVSYLQARYTCETVMVPERSCCQSPGGKVILVANKGLIANYITLSSGCGGTDCPWVLEAPPGQVFNISLYDFSTYTVEELRSASQDRSCEIFANIREAESGARITVCSGETRYKHLYTSTSNSVEIQIVNTDDSGDESAYFAIAFQAFGCPNPDPPIDGFVNREGNRAIITCESTMAQWEIECHDGQWHGQLGDCAKNIPNLDVGGKRSYFTREVYMVLVIAIAFVLAVAIVTTGIVCLYRHWNPIPPVDHNYTDHLPHMQLPDGTYLASEFNYSLPRHHKGYNTVGYKCHTQGGDNKRDHSYLTNVRTNRQNDKGYYSDHTYERPMCDHQQLSKSSHAGYNEFNTERNGSQSSRNEDSNLQPDVRLLTCPRTERPDNFHEDIAT